MTTTVSKVRPFLWYENDVEEAVRLYTSLIPDSRVDGVWTLPAESPSGPPESVKVVEFTLGGAQFQAMQAGQMDNFNHAVSFVVTCDDQAEIDRLWEALGKGGAYEACGWLKDKYGVSWQIVPKQLFDMMKDKDRVRAGRVAKAMLNMVKLEIAPLKDAYEGSKAA